MFLAFSLSFSRWSVSPFSSLHPRHHHFTTLSSSSCRITVFSPSIQYASFSYASSPLPPSPCPSSLHPLLFSFSFFSYLFSVIVLLPSSLPFFTSMPAHCLLMHRYIMDPYWSDWRPVWVLNRNLKPWSVSINDQTYTNKLPNDKCF